jgi:hypothetical protein
MQVLMHRPAGPWPKHMHICLGMEPNRVHTNFTVDDRANTRPNLDFSEALFVDLLHL